MGLPGDDGGDDSLETRPNVRDPGSDARRALLFWEGGGTTLDLHEAGLLVIGRSVEADVRVDHASVSRRHAILHFGHPLCIEDLGSSNGTHVGGRRIAPNVRIPIAPGEVVEIGSAVLVVQQPEPSESAAPTSPTGTDQRGRGGAPGIVVLDPAMERVHRVLELVAQGTLSVLLLGETGVGKEVAAETIHARSPRATGPMLAVNCAALPEALLESELFGHERGAFTGAVATKVGLLEAARGGTLLLDEVGELPPATQAKLLRAVESRQVMRVGAVAPRPIDVRFVSATNRPLADLVKEGRFRQDLFFRLNGATVTMPPLRSRPSEIEPLARLFATRAAADLGRPEPTIAPAALAWLARQPWPGNLRELKNVMERAVLLCTSGPIGLEHVGDGDLAPPLRESPASVGLRDSVEAFERHRIAEALDRCGGNQTQAAKVLGISRRTLLERLDAYALPRPRKDRKG